MARSFFSRILSGSLGRRAQNRDEGARRAFEEGPPGVLGGNPLSPSKDPWTVEWQKRREDVVEQYWKNKKQVLRKRRYAERDLKDHLEHEKREIERNYRLHELKADDPRRKRAQRQTRKGYKLLEKKMERENKENWQRQIRKLQLQRDKQKRKVTKQMKREYRKSRGLPGDSVW